MQRHGETHPVGAADQVSAADLCDLLDGHVGSSAADGTARAAPARAGDAAWPAPLSTADGDAEIDGLPGLLAKPREERLRDRDQVGSRSGPPGVPDEQLAGPEPAVDVPPDQL